MAWFEIQGDRIWSNDHIPASMGGEHRVYGMRLGGRWCLDYTFKLMFGISSEDWNNKFENIKTNQDFYDICESLGIFYMKDGNIYRKGEIYDKCGNKI